MLPPIRLLIDDLINSARGPTEDEVHILRAYIAQAGFDPHTLSRVGRRGANVSWQGQILTGSERFTSDVVHYVRHVLAGQEWPAGTSLQQYLDSLRALVEDRSSGMLLSRYFGSPSLSFIGQSGELRGPQGGFWILVEYRVQLGHWVTGFQPAGGLQTILSDVNREVMRWLHPPT